MKTKFVVSLMVVALAAGAIGWFAARHQHLDSPSAGADTGKLYSCSMHPQVRSNKPGKCPICGMDLAPIGTGQTTGGDGTVMLSSNVINVIHVQTQPVRRDRLV